MTEHTTPHVETLAVVAANNSPSGGAMPAVPPIVPSVGFIHPRLEDADAALGYSGGTPFDPQRYAYSRQGAPTQAAFEEAIAALEGAEAALSFSSGMAALHAAILALTSAGGTVLAAEQSYGLTRSLLNWLAANGFLQVTYADFLDTDAVEQALAETRPDVVLFEVLTNPLVRVIGADRIIALAHAAGAAVAIDNTFATPALLQPLTLGAEMVIHSTTKALNGHGDVLGGVLAGRQEIVEKAYELRKMLGAMPGAFDSWLALRGLRTLALRVRASGDNAAQVAQRLTGDARISRVYYPGLPSDAGHSTAARLFEGRGFGSVLAFEVVGLGREGAFDLVSRLQVIRPVTSLGDLCSLVLHPASSSHRGLTAEQRETLGISEGLLRLSVGIEHHEDLIADLAQALDGVS